MNSPPRRSRTSSPEAEHRPDPARGLRPTAVAEDDEPRLQFARDVDQGLSSRPRFLHCKYLYDRRGTELFEEICQQPEYYLTRTEETILRRDARRIADETGPLTVVELGAGTSSKTHHLLRAYCRSAASPSYLAVDISPSALDQGRQSVERDLPGVHFSSLCCTYEEALPLLSRLGRTMLVFLGSTVGNFTEDAFERFFRLAARHLSIGDYFLLGADLHKDTPTLEAAYDDDAGVTAEFTRNLFARINRELGASIDLRSVKHRAHYNLDEQQVEIFARFSTPQEIHIAPLGARHRIEAGESIRTEVSRKFTVDALSAKLEKIGFATRGVSRDPRDWFALLLLERISPTSRGFRNAT